MMDNATCFSGHTNYLLLFQAGDRAPDNANKRLLAYVTKNQPLKYIYKEIH